MTAEYKKKWYLAHKEEAKAYNETHSEEIAEYKKKWYLAHKEEVKAYNKAYYKSHRKERLLKVPCPVCKELFIPGSIKRHCKRRHSVKLVFVDM